MIIKLDTRNLEFDYGELNNDDELVDVCENLKENLIEVQKVLAKLLPLKAVYDKMSLPAQIELDLFLAYTLNSLHWINLRIQGIDPTTHPIKDEIQRIRVVMKKWQDYKLRHKRPTLNIEVAKRFIRSGLYDRYHNERTADEPPNKKTLFNNEE